MGSAATDRPYRTPLRQPELAVTAAEELGREFAKQGCRIVVFSGSDDFIEGAVVRGYLTSGRASARSIEVHAPLRQEGAPFPEARDRPEIFDPRPDSGSDWEVGFYRAILAADALLLIGGGRTTFNAGVIGLSREVPVVPVAAFGGEAERVWERHRAAPNDATDEDLARAAADWGPESAAQLVESLVSRHDRRVEAARAAERTGAASARLRAYGLVFALVMLAGALACIPLSTSADAPAWRAAAVLVAGPVMIGICGAIIRNAFDDGTGWLWAAVRGAAAGAVTFLLFVAAQTAANPDVLSAESAKNLVYVVLAIGFTAGLGSDAVYAKLRQTDVTPTTSLQ
ncbi:hypothetical protein [Cryptosporangium aurantiacum]|uniref:hypothetical protein n=1 Tax=Cryptosporangium aurantiacum TaxID=134849 RepID=UPI0011610B8A|nr:hypothetical protein [Cryptosporangium aurantiacum]